MNRLKHLFLSAITWAWLVKCQLQDWYEEKFR